MGYWYIISAIICISLQMCESFSSAHSLCCYETPQLLPGTAAPSQTSAALLARHFREEASLLEGVSAPVHGLASASSTRAAPLLLASLPWEKASRDVDCVANSHPSHLSNTSQPPGMGGTKSRTKVLKCWIPKLLFLWQHGALNRNEVCLSHLFSPLGIKASYKNLLRRRHPCCRCLKMVWLIQF